MSRLTRASIFTGLAIGIVIGIAGAVLLNLNSVLLPPAPTQTPEIIYIPTYPTVIPTQDVPLPEQCGRTGGNYQVAYSGQTVGGSYYESLSPDKRTKIFSDNQGVYLGLADGTTRVLYTAQSDYPLPYFAYWSGDNQYVAAAWMTEGPLTIMRTDGSDAHILPGLKFPLNFVSWSPDSRYMALQDNYLGDVSIWTIDGERTYSTAGHQYYVDQPPVWSPDGKMLLFQWRDNTGLVAGGNAPYGFTIAPVDGSSDAEGILTGAEEPNSPFRTIPIWSPDSRYVALTFLQYGDDHYDETVKIYTRSGEQIGEKISSIDGMVYSDLLLWGMDWKGIHWLGGTLFYTQPISKNEFDVMTFDPPKQNMNTLYSGLPKPPFFEERGNGVGIYKNDYSIDILREPFVQLSPEESTESLVTSATDAGDPNWSPGGEWVAAVWATGEKESRRVFLSWMHPDGSGRQDLDADFRDVTDLRWLKDNEALAYIAWRGDTASIEIADTATGERRTIAEGFRDIHPFNYDADADVLSFWWRGTDGSVGKDAYQSDGLRVYRIDYPHDLELPTGEFWSPDGKTVAFKISPPTYMRSNEQLWLAYTDGRPPVKVRDHLTGLGDPLWSPDSELLTFTQSRDFRQPSLQVVDANGADVWDFAPFTIPRSIAWVKCGA